MEAQACPGGAGVGGEGGHKSDDSFRLKQAADSLQACATSSRNSSEKDGFLRGRVEWRCTAHYTTVYRAVGKAICSAYAGFCWQRSRGAGSHVR